MVTVTLLKTVAPTDTSSVMDRSAGSASAGDAIVGYRAFVAVIVAAYFTIIALTPRQSWMPVVPWVQLLPLSALYLGLGIWGFDYARRRAACSRPSRICSSNSRSACALTSSHGEAAFR